MPDSNNPWAELLANNLRVGAVLYKHCDFTTPPKPKYMVVASMEPRLLVLLINSKVNQFYFTNHLDQYHVLVPKEEHDFLRHDSFANCIQAHSAFDITDVRNEVVADYQQVFAGFLTEPCLENVYHAVKGNNILRSGHQKEIVASIEEQLPHLRQAF